MAKPLRIEELKNPLSMRGRSRKFDPEFYKKRPDQARLKHLYNYERDGTLTRKALPSSMSRAKVGETVKGGVCTSGYYQIQVDGIRYFLHQIIWVWHHGYWPENQIDHVNRIRTDNRIENLREVSQSCNMRNKVVCANSRTGVTGVFYRKRDKNFNAYIRFGGGGGKLNNLGYFRDLTEAVCHRYAAEQCLGWHSCDTNSSAYQYLKREGVIK
jgi:hypothetical protein